MSEFGPKSITRFVLLTLSLHMDKDGGSCFPSTRTLAGKTGLSERSVCTHLETAAKEGWIKKMLHGLPGQRWKRHKYEADIPENLLKEIQHLNSKGTEPYDKKALKEVQSSTSVNSSKRTPDFFSLKNKYDSILVDNVFRAIASTRKNGKVADSVLFAQLRKWERYPVEQVEAGIQIYLEKDYAGQGKREEYLLGIIRNQKPNEHETAQHPQQKEITMDNIDELYEN